jgi:hypothetical protein
LEVFYLPDLVPELFNLDFAFLLADVAEILLFQDFLNGIGFVLEIVNMLFELLGV